MRQEAKLEISYGRIAKADNLLVCWAFQMVASCPTLQCCVKNLLGMIRRASSLVFAVQESLLSEHQ